jgi:hypothetical protein
MQYLYTLTSDLTDYYYEQLLLSAASLKLKMPGAEITLLCDSSTESSLKNGRTKHKNLVSNIITAQTPLLKTKTEISRWLKTSMRRMIQGDFLFIDCDTIIAEDLSSITEQGIQFGACLDKHSLLNKHGKNDKIIERDKQLGFTSYLSNRHINSGVIFCADTPDIRKIFDRWHELWLFSNSKKITMDQAAFNMAIYENPGFFTELDGAWNCQIAFNGLPFLADAKIIHYFASSMFLHTPPFTLGSDAVFQKIKETGKISDDIMEMLKNPRAAFENESRIITGTEMLEVLNSHVFDVFLWFRKNKPWIFNIFNRLASVFIRTFKRILPGKGNGL